MIIKDTIVGTRAWLCVAIISLLATAHAEATDFNWKAPVSGNFSTSANWNPTGIPGSTDAAIFNLGSAGYTVSPGIENVNILNIDNDMLTFGGSSLTAHNSILPSIALGNNTGDVANLTVNSTRITGVNDAIGYAAQTNGTATLNSATWSSANQYVGYAGTGTLALNQGTVTASTSEVIGSQAGSHGTVTLAGRANLNVNPPQNNSMALVVGASGTGTLSVSSGRVTLSDQMIVAQNALSQGTVTLDGANSTLTTPTAGNLNMSGLTVGMGGNGSLSLANGASATIAGPFTIGQNAGSQGSLSVAGTNSLLTPPGFGSSDITSVTVGASGVGSLSVTGGATAKLSKQVVIGQNAGSQGSLTIADTNSLLTSLNAGNSGITGLTVGAAGQGSFSVTGGGTAQLSGPILVGNAAGGKGAVTIDGAGSQLVDGHNRISGITVGNSGTGSFSVTGGGLTSIGAPVIVGQNAGSAGSVTIDGANSKLTNTDQSGNGIFTVGKDGTGQISIAHGGTLVGQFVSMIIGSDANSNGTVSVDGTGSNLTLGGHVPGGSATILVGQNGTGTLSASGGATIASGMIYVGPSTSGSSGYGSLILDGAGTGLTITGGLQIGSGSLTISNGASVSTYFNLNANAGSAINIQGGTLTASSVVSNGTLIDNGTINGNVQVGGLGGAISGAGTISGQLLVNGASISPGNSPGTLTAGSLDLTAPIFKFDINGAGGIAGGPIGWDLLASQNLATFHNTLGGLTLDVVSLTQGNGPGNVFDFNPAQDYHWTFLTAGGGLSGFAPASVVIDTSGFSNPFGGRFNVSQVGDSLLLNYIVPEPSTLALFAFGFIGLAIWGWWRK